MTFFLPFSTSADTRRARPSTHTQTVRPRAPNCIRVERVAPFARFALGLITLSILGCGSGDGDTLGTAQSAGGTAGVSGTAGASGASAAQAGDAGSGGAGASHPGGSAGTAGSAGDAGTSGSAGISGTAGVAGSSGVAGMAGMAGTAGDEPGGAAGNPCATLVPAGGPIGVNGSPTRSEQRPTLVLTDASLSALAAPVALVFATLPLESPIEPPVAIEHVEFHPWDVFPSTLGTASVAMQDGGLTYAAGAAKGTGFSLAAPVISDAQPPSGEPRISLDARVQSGEFADGSTLDGTAGFEPIFTTSSASLTCAGLRPPVVGQHHAMSVAVVTNAVPSIYSEAACATSDIVADAIPWDDGVLLAYSTSRDCCQCDDGVDGPPGTLVLTTLSSAGVYAQLATLDAGRAATYSFARLIPTPGGGAWVITKVSGGVVDGPFVARQISATGLVNEASFEIIPPGATYQAPALAGLGAGLGVAWIDESGQVPHAKVRAFAPSGEGTTPLGFEAGFAASLSAVASPDGRHLLVGWYTYGSADQPSRVSVERFDCAGPAL